MVHTVTAVESALLGDGQQRTKVQVLGVRDDAVDMQYLVPGCGSRITQAGVR